MVTPPPPAPSTLVARAKTFLGTKWAALRSSWHGIPIETLSPETGQAVLWGVGVLALCAYTMGLPFIRSGDTADMAIVGLSAGLFTLLLNGVYVLKGPIRHYLAVGSICFLLLAGGLVLSNARPMIDTAAANDDRCRALQKDMLSSHPRKANGPDLFQALGCSPSGADRRIFVPPTDREIAAGHSLPHGGYTEGPDRSPGSD